MNRNILLVILFSLLLGLIGSAHGLYIDFLQPTPVNYTNTTNQSIEFNVSINGSAISQIWYDWNGTNYSVYDDNLIFMANFDNRTDLGDNSTYAIDNSK